MRISIFIFVVFLMGCERSEMKPLPGDLFFPQLQEYPDGMVWKYFCHQESPKSQRKTDILYRKMSKDNDVLTIADYNAGFLMTHLSEYKMEKNCWILLSEKSFKHRQIDTSQYIETTHTIGEDNIFLDWKNPIAKLQKSYSNATYQNHIITRQLSIQDTLIDGIFGKLLEGEREFIKTYHNSTTADTTFIFWKKYFQKDMGLVRHEFRVRDNKYTLDLDEIMTFEEFDRRTNHGTYRVAYIDTLQTMDDHTKFKPCYHIDKINDYYNDRRAQIKGGKGRLRAMLKEKLNPKLLEGESGYLTFRFVINCEGEAGWFTTEEADLNFNKKKFNKVSKMHLYNLLKAEKEWFMLIIRKKQRDAYTYITFKLEEGEIIEILP